MLDNVSFAFVMDLIDVKCSLPFKIIEDCYFQKATPKQVERIKQFLSTTGYFNYSSFPYLPYEHAYILDESLSKGGYTLQPLEINDWRYYVLAFECTDSKIYQLAKAANISESELEFNVHFCKVEGLASTGEDVYATRKNRISVFNHFYKLSNQVPPLSKNLEDKDLQELSSIYQDIKQLDETKFPQIKQAIEMFDDLKHLPHHSSFNILGLFTIIEFLITHKPTDTGDSLAQQVATKIPLLSRRFYKTIDYSVFDQNASETTIWKKLYTYRSNIAHGNLSDFSKELSLLKNSYTAHNFLKSVVKKLLRHALIESQLYVDLKKC
jgi:hypothetical protein